ncbi:MAG: hypothetical protein H7A51_00400 [Akkermansiaceae bacterium]|nr:hypothetical protein [Akkermansiaceae bacterium]
MNNEINIASCRIPRGAALALALATTSATSLFAGPDAKTTIDAPPANNGDFCSWLQNSPGTLYKSSDNAIIQEVGIFGRVQYQQAWIDGDSNGQDFWYDSEGQFRRVRLGAQIKFLNLFSLKGNADMMTDGRPSGGDLDWGYANIYEAALTFNAKKAFNISSLDRLDLAYGKSEIRVSHEVNTSSKKIKTIERSALANKVFPTNLTGAWIDAARGKLGFYLGVFSTMADNEFADWNTGELYHARVTYDITDSTSFDKAEALVAFVYADHDGPGDTTISFDWAASAAISAQQGQANYMANIIYGSNRDDATRNRGGDFWGVVLMPTYWITENRLEAVFRYQYAHASESQGIQLNSRYARNAGHASQENIPTLAGGRGDEHHSIYLGLNYYLCGDNSKIMAGVEWDDISSNGNDVYQGITYGLAYRMFF